MSNSQSAHLNVDAESGHHIENNNMMLSNDVPTAYPNGVPAADPVDANLQVAININFPTDPEIVFARRPVQWLEKRPKVKVMG